MKGWFSIIYVTCPWYNRVQSCVVGHCCLRHQASSDDHRVLHLDASHLGEGLWSSLSAWCDRYSICHYLSSHLETRNVRLYRPGPPPPLVVQTPGGANSTPILSIGLFMYCSSNINYFCVNLGGGGHYRQLLVLFCTHCVVYSPVKA